MYHLWHKQLQTLQCLPALHKGGVVHEAVRGLQQRKGVNLVLEGLQQPQSAIKPGLDKSPTPVALHDWQQCFCCFLTWQKGQSNRAIQQA